jgi:hypothetical protein
MQTVSPTKVYPVLGWFGAVAFFMFIVVGGLGAVIYARQTSSDGFKFESIIDVSMDATLQEQNTESALSPEEQAEFDAFMQEYGDKIESRR